MIEYAFFVGLALYFRSGRSSSALAALRAPFHLAQMSNFRVNLGPSIWESCCVEVHLLDLLHDNES
jgi:hypothetical protein